MTNKACLFRRTRDFVMWSTRKPGLDPGGQLRGTRILSRVSAESHADAVIVQLFFNSRYQFIVAWLLGLTSRRKARLHGD